MPKIAFAELKTQYSRSSLAAGTNLGSPQQNRASHQAPLKRNRFAGDTKKPVVRSPHGASTAGSCVVSVQLGAGHPGRLTRVENEFA